MELVAGLDDGRAARQERLLVADDQVDQRLPRQPELLDHAADRRVLRLDAEREDVAAELLDHPRLDDGAGEGGLAGRQPEPAGKGLEREALEQGRDHDDEEDDVEELSAPLDPRDHRQRREPDRNGAAEAGPAQHHPFAEPERLDLARQQGRDRAGDEDQDQSECRALPGDVDEPAREDEQPEHEEERDLRDPAQALVERGDRAPRRDDPGAEREAGQVDGEESRALADVGEAEGEGGGRHRGDGVEAGRRVVEPDEGPARAPADEAADDRADDQVAGELDDHVREAVAGLVDPGDQPGHEQDGDRVVQARLALERPGEPALQLRLAEDGEDRGRVGGRDGGADDQRLERAEVEQPRRRQPGDHGGDDRADHRQRDRRPQHRPDLLPARGQPALEEDQDESDGAERPRQLDVVEGDAADPLAADEHPEAQEQDQSRHAYPVRDHRRGDSGAEQEAADQDQLCVGQGSLLLLAFGGGGRAG